MSFFLGPIHHYMYSKIRVVWMRTGATLEALVNQYGEEVEKAAGVARSDFQTFNGDRPLDELVADRAIHDWLQWQIDTVEQVEGRVMVAAQKVGGDGALQVVCDAARAYGEGVGKEAASEAGGFAGTAEELFRLLDAQHLETMPCTQVTEFGQMDGKHVYRHLACPHLENWKASGAEPKAMCQMVTAWMSGFTSGAGKDLHHEPGQRIVDGQDRCEDFFVAKEN